MPARPWFVAAGAPLGLILAGLTDVDARPPTPPDAVLAPSRTTPRLATEAPPRTVITVSTRTRRGPIGPALLGVNHHYVANGFGIWDVAGDQPEPRVVRGIRRAGISLVRYPGGTHANLFRWERAVERPHQCQVNGKRAEDGGFRSVQGIAYGPDEHLELTERSGAKPVLMVQSITETPRGAANWVEYMNAPSGTAHNPNGGVDWAERRASNGHPAPYRVKRWEIGNEQRFSGQRYWMSTDQDVALRQYTNGATVQVNAEALGKRCNHPVGGVASNGRSNQTFAALYPPVQPTSMRVTVDGTAWSQVGTLVGQGTDAQVYTLAPGTGEVTFGNGRSGAVPPAGAVIRATYRSVHAGVFAFIRAMKEVDPSIRVCPSWGLAGFSSVARPRRYDCHTTHAYTFFQAEGHDDWAGPAEGYGWHMLGLGTERRFIAELDAALPRGVSLPVSEYGVLFGDREAWPTYDVAMVNAIYLASTWIAYMDLGVPWATGSPLTSPTTRGTLGPRPHFTFSAEAVARQAVAPMFEAAGHEIGVRVAGNRIRDPGLGAGSYRGLVAAASRSRSGAIHLLVVNRLPNDRDAIRARIVLGGFTTDRKAHVRAVHPVSYRSANLPGQAPRVRLEARVRPARDHGMVFDFPPHSITVIRFDPATR